MYNHPSISKEEYLDIFTFPVIEYYRKELIQMWETQQFKELPPLEC